MTDKANPRLAAWQAFKERIEERDKLRDRIADIGALVVKQAEIVSDAPAHNDQLARDQVSAYVDGTKAPTAQPVNIDFETAKLDALRERLSDARSDLPSVQSKAEYLLVRAKDADRDALAAWSRATLNLSSAEPLDGRTSKVTVAEICGGFVEYRAGGGNAKFAEYMDSVITFSALDEAIAEQRKIGIEWFDENHASLDAEAAE